MGGVRTPIIGRPRPLPVGNVTLGVGALSYTGRFELMAVADADGYRDRDVFAAGCRDELMALAARVASG